MKKLLALLMAVILAASLFAGCSDSDKESTKKGEGFASAKVDDDNSDSGKEKTDAEADDEDEEEEEDEDFDLEDDADFDEDEVVENIGVTPYTYFSDYDNDLVLVFENKSNSDCELEVAVDFLDSKGKLIGTETQTIEAFAKGTKTAAVISCDEKFAKYEYELTASETGSFIKCVTQNLTCKVTPAKNKAIVSVTNNGNKKPSLITAYALFFKGEKLVAHNFGYVDGMKKGKTKKTEINATYFGDLDFDSVQVYLDGYAY